MPKIRGFESPRAPRDRENVLQELRGKLRCAMEQADRGEFLDGETVFEEIRKLGTCKRTKKK